jgi:hypothetical protein
MIIWGGEDIFGTPLHTGGRFTPTADLWLPTSVGEDVPSERAGHIAVWTGSQMLVWAGYGGSAWNGFTSGGRYTPPSPGPAAPAAPTFSSVAHTSLTVNWTAVPGATTYSVLRAIGGACTTATTIATAVAGTSYIDSNLACGSQYSYSVVAINECGPSAGGACGQVTTTVFIPAAPTAPTFSSIGCATLNVNWAAVSGAASYDVWRSTGATCAGAVKVNASPVSGTTLDDTGLTGLTQYSYFIVANNACGASADGNCASVVTTAVPSVPTGVSAVAACTTVTVSWTPSAGAISYNVLRGTVCGTAVTTFPNVASPYVDSTGVAGMTYQYWVVGVNICGTSSNSGCAAVTTTTPPIPAISGPASNACPTPYVTLTASTGYVGYQWKFNGTPMAGATQSTYNASLSGNYTVTVNDAAGCTGTSAPKAVTVIYCATAEVSPALAPVPLRLVKDAGSPTGYYLYFQKANGTGGYNIYEGALGTWYSHASAPGNLCNAAVTDLGTGEMRAAIAPSSGGRYYLVTGYRLATEGPSGYDSNSVAIPASQSTCAP